MKRIFYSLACAALLLTLKPAARAQTVSVNFVGGNGNGGPAPMAPTETAGARPATHWNNAPGNTANNTPLSLVDSTGAATTLTVDWEGSPNTWAAYYNDQPGDYRMMKGYLDTTDSSTTTITVAGLNAGKSYLIYLYAAGADSGGYSSLFTLGSQTFAVLYNPFSGSYTQATSTDPVNPSPGNYVVFTVSGQTSVTLSGTPDKQGGNGFRAPINGFQVIALNATAAPTGLTAFAGTSRVTLGFNADANAVTYNIKRGASASGPFTTIASVSGNGYTDTTVTNGTKYYYEVTAVNALGESGPSNIASATPQAGLDGTGLTGQYWNNNNNTGYGPGFNYAAAPPDVTEIDPTINLDVNGANGAFQPAGIGHDNFNAQWTGLVQAQVTGPYVFTTASDDGSRLYIDGQLVVDNYNYQGVTSVSSAPITFAAGSKHLVKYLFFQGGGGGEAHFYWSYPGQSQQTVPQYALFPTYGAALPYAPTLAGSVFNANVFLNWTTVDNAATYNVLRASKSGGPYTVIAAGQTGNTYVDSNVTIGTTYYYVVQAVNTYGTSPNSNEVALIPAAPAPFIAAEEFDYSPSNIGGLNGGLGWADAWTGGTNTQITAPGLTFGSLTVAGNTAALGTGNNNNNNFRHLATREGSYHGANTVFLSYVARLDPANAGTLGANDGYAGLSIYDENNEQIFTGLRYNGTLYGLESEVNGQGSSDTSYLVDNTLHFFVFQFDFSADNGPVTISEFVDPIPGGTLPATPDATKTVTAFNFNRIRIGNGYSNNNTPILEDFDEIRFGRTYAAVSPVTGATVTGRVSLEGVTDLSAVSPVSPLGTFSVTFRDAASGAVVKTATVALATTAGSANGTFTVSGIPAGTYNVIVKGAKNLAVLVPNVVVSATSGTVPPVILPAGDSNGDNSVDSSDFGTLIGAFNTDGAISGSGYDPAVDFNFDGTVDSSDFGLLIGQFNNVGAI